MEVSGRQIRHGRPAAVNTKEDLAVMERPHSRKKKVAEGTAEVRKGEKLENSQMTGSGDAPLAGNEKETEETDK